MSVLTDHINRWYKRSNRKPEDDKGEIHPSTLNECHRQAIYKYLGLPRDIGHNEFKQAMFFHGYAIEDMMNEALEEAGLLIAKNVAVRAELKGVPVVGTIDHVIRWPPKDPDGWCLADTKSVSAHAFKWLSFPYHHHVMQVGAYQWALRQMLKLSIGELMSMDITMPGAHRLKELSPDDEYSPVLFYIGRGNLKAPPGLSVGSEAMHAAVAEMTDLTGYIERDVVPECPFESPNTHPYLCSTRIKKGYQKRDGTYSPGKEPLYIPNCEFFYRCWRVEKSLKQWSSWLVARDQHKLEKE